MKQIEEETIENELELQEGGGIVSEEARKLLNANAYLGHHPSKTNPKMKPFTIGSKNAIEVINIDQTVNFLIKACKFVEDLGRQRKRILFVGSNPIVRDIVKKASVATDSPRVIGRWIGGLITNFSIISKRLRYFWDLKEKSEKGELKKYTKKEQGEFNKSIEKMTRLFDGLDLYTRLPDALIITDVEFDSTALHEANILNVPVVAIINTDSDPEKTTYPIPASNHIRSSVEYILNELVTAYNKGKSEKEITREE